MALRGHTVWTRNGYIDKEVIISDMRLNAWPTGASHEQRGMMIQATKKKKARADFWKRYAESHPRMTDPAVKVAKT